MKKRHLFKRVIVISSAELPEDDLWTKLNKFSGKATWALKLTLQREFQKQIASRVMSAESNSSSTSITDDIKNKFSAYSGTTTILLVDIPPDKKDADFPLEYLIEEDRRRYKVDIVPRRSLEKSIVWTTLQKNFRESIGKVRIFCDKDYSEFILGTLDRDAIKSALNEALEIVTNEE